MIENRFHRWGLIALVIAVIVAAGTETGTGLWASLLVGVPAILVFHGVMTWITRRQARAGTGNGAGADQDAEDAEDATA